jgi:hypothetical protein
MSSLFDAAISLFDWAISSVDFFQLISKAMTVTTDSEPKYEYNRSLPNEGSIH